MNKKTKLLILISAVLAIAIAMSGCSATKNKEEQEIDSSDNNQMIDESLEETIEDDAEEVTAIKLPAFNLKDLEGNDISSEIFNDYDMTIVSIWQSTCGPCMEELGALNVIYDEYEDKGVNVIGISVDNVEVMGDEGVKKVAEILKLKFPNVIADDDYLTELVNYVQGTPTAFIVGEDGELLMDPRVGTNGKDEDIEDFRNIIEETIAE